MPLRLPERVYKMISSTGAECHFLPVNVSSLIKGYDAKSKLGEFGSQNKQEVTSDSFIRVKERCYKLEINRLGIPLNRLK
ncbi:hypothetical protein A3SI_16582 [Nitritalea halalkaliphila LW7]|uniref:Uncharacterized protein n=2 Tax=Nitritalea TaxID=1187887 RepID=I5BWY5_9BACT|nr:hypothetical protein A3SI_16582 [Nitritalea halalkaliphila LW7]